MQAPKNVKSQQVQVEGQEAEQPQEHPQKRRPILDRKRKT